MSDSRGGNGASGGNGGDTGNGRTGSTSGRPNLSGQMTDPHSPMPSVQPGTGGRGRGSGSLQTEARLTESDSETSGKRSAPDSHIHEISKRGRHREGVELEEVFYTKPDHVQSKAGTSGRMVQLLTNHFKLRFNPRQKFRQYRIDFSPDCDDLRLRKALIYQQQEVFGSYIFDGGNLIYLTRNLEKTSDYVSRSREGIDYKLIIKDTGTEISFTTSMGNYD